MCQALAEENEILVVERECDEDCIWTGGKLTVLTTLPDLSITAIVWPSGAIASDSRRRLAAQEDHSSESARSTAKAGERCEALVNKVPLVGDNSRLAGGLVDVCGI